MIKVKLVKYKGERETKMKYYTHAHGLREAVGALKWYQRKNEGMDGTAYLEVDGVYVCDFHLDDFFGDKEPTINSCEAFLLSIASDMEKQGRMGEEDVWELNEQEIDRGFLAGITGNKKEDDSPYYNRGYQDGVRCAQ